MAVGRGIQLTRQIGEHLVVAELGRLGYVAAPYAGFKKSFSSGSADQVRSYSDILDWIIGANYPTRDMKGTS